MSELVDDAMFADDLGYPCWCSRCRQWFNSDGEACPDCGWPGKDDRYRDGKSLEYLGER